MDKYTELLQSLTAFRSAVLSASSNAGGPMPHAEFMGYTLSHLDVLQPIRDFIHEIDDELRKK